MKIEGTYSLSAAPERAYAALLDPKVLQRCIPGCERLQPAGDKGFDAVLSVGVAAIRGRYTGTVKILAEDPPHSCEMLIEGNGAPGFVRGRSLFTIAPLESGSQVQVAADVEVGGTIARVGQRVIGGISKHMMKQFFDDLKKELA